MKKIVVEKDDTAADVVRKILAQPHTEITLVAPKGAHIRGAITNFYTIEKEATKAGRTITIESVDDEILAFARAANMEAVHPLFQGNRRSATTSDIVFTKKTRTPTPEEIIEEDRRQEAMHHEQSVVHHNPQTVEIFSPHTDIAEKNVHRIDEGDAPQEFPRAKRNRVAIVKKAVAVVLVCALLGAGAWASLQFSRAQVAIQTKKYDWSTTMQVRADVNVQSVNTQTGVVPAELFFQQKNFTQIYKASAVQDVSTKATGQITIFNAYSSKQQSLVASTRFETPDGKIFRLTKTVNVPGAVIAGGKITPASIQAEVTADAPGESFNISQETKVTIPGFKNSDKFAGFYGTITQTSGGFQGKKPYPTDADIDAAKKKAIEVVTASLQSWYANPRTKDFKILDNTSALQITKTSVNPNTDAQGNFSVFVEGSLQVIAFREQDIRAIAQAKAELAAAGSVINDKKTLQNVRIEYGNPTINLAKKTMDMNISMQATVVPTIETTALAAQVQGKTISEAEGIVAGLADVASARISLWPRWASTIPTDQNRIHIEVSPVK